MNSRPVGAKLIHADRQTDITKLIGAFHQYAKAPKNAFHDKQYRSCHGLGV